MGLGELNYEDLLAVQVALPLRQLALEVPALMFHPVAIEILQDSAGEQILHLRHNLVILSGCQGVTLQIQTDLVTGV